MLGSGEPGPKTHREDELVKSALKHVREESGIGQLTFARRIGTSQGHVSDVENGRRDMTPDLAFKAAGELGIDGVRLYLAHTYGAIKAAEEEGDPAAPSKALGLARKLLEILEEGGLDEERAEEVRTIIEELLKIVEGATAAASPTKPVASGKPPTPLKPALVKASGSSDVMGTLRRLGAGRGMEALNEDEAYERLVEAGLSAAALEGLLDEISTRMSSSLIGDAERQSLEALQAAAERRIAELAADGGRPSEQVLAGDRAAVKARARAESRERRNQSECYDVLGLDQFGRPIPEARKDHDRALKSSRFLSEDEKELGVDRRGLPLNQQRLRNRRYIEEG